MSSIRYRPEIDGLRTIAVVPVILFHMGFPWMAGGFLGVDVFFVISGFLITSIILKEYDKGVFTFRAFWMRRIKRILPVLSVMVLATAAVNYFWSFRGEHPAVGAQGVSALLSFANIKMWTMLGDYWGPQAESSPFLHTWSLSVEEQYYLVFPLMIFLILKYAPQRLGAVLVWLFTASLALFLYGAVTRPNPTFFLLPTRAWELGAGCLLAVMMFHRNPNPAEPSSLYASLARNAAFGGLLLTIVSYFTVADTSGVSGSFVIPVLGASLVIAFGQSGLANTVLSNGLMVFIGKLSYSLYLWHWPVLVYAKQAGGLPSYVSGAIIFGLSLISYYAIETPARLRNWALIPTGLCFSSALALCLYMSTAYRPYDISQYAKMEYDGYYYDISSRGVHGFRGRNPGVDLILRPAADVPPEKTMHDGVIENYGGETPRIVVLGDSHGGMWSRVISDIAKERGVTTAFYIMNGVNPCISFPISRTQYVPQLSSAEKYRYDEARVEAIKKWKPEIVILASRWTRWNEAEQNAARSFFQFLQEHAKHVLIVEQPPEVLTGASFNVAQYLSYLGMDPQAGQKQYLPASMKEYERGSGMIQQVAAEFPKCKIIRTGDRYIGNDGQTCVLDGDEVVYLNQDHVTQYGAKMAYDRFKEEILGCMDERAQAGLK